MIKGQRDVSPKAQYALTQRFDPQSTSYGHGKSHDSKRSILHPDLKTVPHQQQVQLIGHGHIDSYEGLENFDLKHPHHRTFHRDPIPAEKDHDFTRFYRWHIDAALYDLYPPKATTLLAVQVPKGRRQTLLYDDGSGDTLDCHWGQQLLSAVNRCMIGYPRRRRSLCRRVGLNMLLIRMSNHLCLTSFS